MNSLLRLFRPHRKRSEPPATDRPTTAAIPARRLRQLTQLCTQLQYDFSDISTLDRALTHSSFRNALAPDLKREKQDYESLEFLGDAVLAFLISEELLKRFPDMGEGALTKMRAFLVSTDQLFQLSSSLELGQYLLVSPGEEKTGGRQKKRLLADVFESVIAAVYLDGGLMEARSLVLRCLSSLLEQLATGEADFKNHKSELQELLHTRGMSEPTYRTVTETGPDHRKEFVVQVCVKGKPIASGAGRSKKQAEQRAARLAVERFTTDEPDKP